VRVDVGEQQARSALGQLSPKRCAVHDAAVAGARRAGFGPPDRGTRFTQAERTSSARSVPIAATIPVRIAAAAERGAEPVCDWVTVTG
jgi:hypothetical protein